ncbi:MAG: hypothetical protein Udaeo2_31510 [Candidatus Udaeobacter sp.]|nr:MAG: hypothetical protein Udaeo2_31510 [Candidatus Udaeobacter sp.]
MAAGIRHACGETERHSRLKRLAFLWSQAQGYSACAMEVSLPKCRYRADVASYRRTPKKIGSTAIFECKQTLCDLRRDNCQSDAIRQRLETIWQRRQLLERRLRAHYPNLRTGDSLFPEFDLPDLTVIGHRGYARLLRELRALQNRLYDCTKFDKLLRYRCANLYFLVLPEDLFRDSEIPVGWGALVENDGALTLVRKPIWHETTAECHIRLLHRIAVAGTRVMNRKLEITFDEIVTAERYRSC